jgi:hypothetical protein
LKGTGACYVIRAVPKHCASFKVHIAIIQNPAAASCSYIRFYVNTIQDQKRAVIVKNPSARICRIIGDLNRGTGRTAVVENTTAGITSGISGYENVF